MANERRRFEYVEGTSNKFWEVGLDGGSLTVRWGRIGTDGQLKTKRFPSPTKAEAARDKLIQEKLGEGYVEATRQRKQPPKPAALVQPSDSNPLTRLDALWKAKRPDLRRALRKPATPRLLDELQRAAGLPLPEPLRCFYLWHDGCRDEHLAVEGFFGWPSAKQTLSHKRTLDELDRDGHFSDWAPGRWWHPSWIPFLQFNYEDFVCIDLAGILGKGRGSVFVRRNTDPKRVVIAPSFERWLAQHIALTESGPDDGDEDEWIEHFDSPIATTTRRQIAPGFPVVVSVRRA